MSISNSGSSSGVAPFQVTLGTNSESFIIREAREDDFEKIGWGASEAFLDDVMMNYFSGATEVETSVHSRAGRHLHDFYLCIYKACVLSGGRVVVAQSESTDTSTDPNAEVSIGGNIAAASCWYPPTTEMKLRATIRAGVWTVIRDWGLRGIKRSAGDYTHITDSIFRQAFKAKSEELQRKGSNAESKSNSKRSGVKRGDAWYLQNIYTAKRYEGRGLMSALVREAYRYAQYTQQKQSTNTNPVPSPFILESTSLKSRARYIHLGFEVVQPLPVIGAGIVTSQGLGPVKGEKRVLKGIEYACMINWDCLKDLPSQKKVAAEVSESEKESTKA